MTFFPTLLNISVNFDPLSVIAKLKNMVFKRPGNSRDDRSSGAPKRNSKGTSQARNSASPRFGKSNSFDSKQEGDKPKRSYSDRDGSSSDKKSFAPKRKPYTGRPDSDDRPKRSFDREGSDERKSFGPRKDAPYSGRPTGDDRPKRESSYRGDRESTGEKRPYTPRKSSSGYGDKKFEDKPKRSYSRDSSGEGESTGERKQYTPRKSSSTLGERSFADRPRKSADRNSAGGSESTGERKPYAPRKSSSSFGDGPKKPFNRAPSGDRKFGDKPGFKSGDKKFGDRPATSRFDKEGGERNERPYRKSYNDRDNDRPDFRNETSSNAPERVMRGRRKPAEKEDAGLIRLNRYISNAGICSRRKADELIAAGVVSVNGEVINELGYKVDPAKDVIRYNGETLKREKNVYVLLNKPKDYITTTDDPQERRTVMHLVEKASKERIYPIGRLDRNTTGLLLMTNDGDLADKLSHPKNNITKLYQVELDKSLTQGDLNKIAFGLELEDGFIKPDMVSYVAGGSKREVGIQIHSGKNRIVRRIFEHLGYDVVKLDRSVYANLTKKDLPRGRWRYLDEHEIIQLKHLV